MEKNNKKKNTIGILTFHTADNYGAVLQTYALQTFLEMEGDFEVEVINFRTKQHDADYAIFRHRRNNILKNLLINSFALLLYPFLKLRKKRFIEFRNKYLHLSSVRYLTEQELLNHIPEKDIYITGSDQVFNPYNQYLKAYYLGFNKKTSKKIAYAPSFGVSKFTKEITDTILPYLQDFDALSCREKQGSDYLSSILLSKIPTVVDPVFLLSKEDWSKIALQNHKIKPYIFVYDLNGGTKLLKKAKELSEVTSLPVICCTCNINVNYHVEKQLYSLGPLELLGYIMNAEYVVTDSFHGTSLSLILRKTVYPFIAFKEASSRITSIMSLLNLSNFIIDNQTKMETISKVLPTYDSELTQLIKESKSWIMNSLH